MKYESIAETVGNTPLVKISKETHRLDNVELYAKMEMMNPFGSVKDRIGKKMYWDNKEHISQNTIIESSSGNTAKALAALTGTKHKFKTVTNRIQIEYVKKLLKILNTDIVELPGTNECPDPTNPQNPVAVIEQEVKEQSKEYYHTNQYFNQENPEAHRETGKEILKDLPGITDFFADIGTSGTTRGIGEYLRENKENSPNIHGVLTEGGSYVPGGRDMNELFETGFFQKEFYDHIHNGTTQDAINGMLHLIQQEGILCGPTTGLVFKALRKELKDTKRHKKVVFIACDRMEPYVEYLEKHRPSIFNNKVEEQSLPEPQSVSEDNIPPNAILVDTRVPYAYRRSGYPKSINIPLNHLEELLQETTIFSEDKPVVLICAQGEKTKKVVSTLLSQEIDAYNLEGGTRASKKV